ncbi:MAG: ABC transporter permease [Burkholderiales bacterium]|nr:ABC transporter permease [Burkholderiales bacterium]
MAASPQRWLTLPLAAFLFACFALPLAWMFSLAVREAEVPRALPRTLAALQGWSAAQPVPSPVFAALAQDIVEARAAGTLADAARRLNYATNGVRSSLMRAAREAEAALARSADGASSGTAFDDAFFAAADPMLASPAFFAAVQQAAGPVSAFYLLAALDLERDERGAVVMAPADQRVYLDVLGRTLGISAAVTVLCLVLGFPVAVLLTQVQGRAAEWLMALVMLPFWTSLLVRTAAWVVLLQREGLINSLLVRLGLVTEPLALIYNRTGVLVAMTHVLLPFMILPVYAVLKDIPPNYLRAAASLGAPPLSAFWRVYLPLAAPGVAGGALMVFILALGYYITPALVGGGGDQMLSYFIARYTAETGNWGLAAALGLVLLAATYALYALAQRLSGGRALRLG